MRPLTDRKKEIMKTPDINVEVPENTSKVVSYVAAPLALFAVGKLALTGFRKLRARRAAVTIEVPPVES